MEDANTVAEFEDVEEHDINVNLPPGSPWKVELAVRGDDGYPRIHFAWMSSHEDFLKDPSIEHVKKALQEHDLEVKFLVLGAFPDSCQDPRTSPYVGLVPQMRHCGVLSYPSGDFSKPELGGLPVRSPLPGAFGADMSLSSNKRCWGLVILLREEGAEDVGMAKFVVPKA
jgi:hypothetical protein